MIKSFSALFEDNEPDLEEMANESGQDINDIAKSLYEDYEQSVIDLE